MHHTYRIIIEPDERGYHGYVPALRGCHTWGKTVAATMEHLQEAIAVYLESLLDYGEAIPQDRSFESFATVEPRRSRRRARVRSVRAGHRTRQYA